MYRNIIWLVENNTKNKSFFKNNNNNNSPDKHGNGGVSPVNGTFIAMIELGRPGFEVPANNKRPDLGIANCPNTISDETGLVAFVIVPWNSISLIWQSEPTA